MERIKLSICLAMFIGVACSSIRPIDSGESNSAPIVAGSYSLLNCNLSEDLLNQYFASKAQNIKGNQRVSLTLNFSTEGPHTLSGEIGAPEYELQVNGATEKFKSAYTKLSKLEVSSITHFEADEKSPESIVFKLADTSKIVVKSKNSKSIEVLKTVSINGAMDSDEFSVFFSAQKMGLQDLTPLLLSIPQKCEYTNMDLLKRLSRLKKN